MALVAQYLKRTSERVGLFDDFERGISQGCPLSPVIGAFFLAELDQALERTGMFFARFMDDVVVLAPTRWKLRRATLARVGAACPCRLSRLSGGGGDMLSRLA